MSIYFPTLVLRALFDPIDMPQAPLLAPLFPEGREPLPPGWTEDDRLQAMEAKKWEKRFGAGTESCAGKAVMSGVVGSYFIVSIPVTYNLNYVLR